jgi:Protein of unknown function (DUF2786)
LTAPLPEPDRSLVDRVRKLLDKAARTDNEHEADVFARKAAELVARHRIDPARLAEAVSVSDLAVAEISVGRGAYVRARLALLGGIAHAHDVRMVFQATPTGTVALLAGHRAELGVVEVIYTSLHQQAGVHMARIRKSTGAATQRDRRAFLFGFADRIGELLNEARSSVEQREPTRPGTDGAMTVALKARRDRVDEFAEQTWGKVRSAAQPKTIAMGGYAVGVNAAERADVGRTRLAGRRALDSGA